MLAGSVPPGVDTAVYARLIGELERLGVPTVLDTDGEPMRLGLRAEPAVVAPNVAEAEEAVGHEFNDADDVAMGLAGLLEMGAREAVITREAGCVAIVDDEGRRRYEVEIERARAGLGRRLGRLLPGRLRRRPLRGGIAARVSRLRASPAGLSRPSTSARATSTRTRSNGCCLGSRSGSWTSPPA